CFFGAQYSHEPYVAVPRFHVLYLGKPVGHLAANPVERRAAALARLETQLKQTPYLVGERLTLADIALVAYTRVAHEGGFDLSLYPAVKAWVARVEVALDIH
ncbi:MAG: glutathione S-transferase, partial [Caulobacter sp. 39-67-4]